MPVTFVLMAFSVTTSEIPLNEASLKEGRIDSRYQANDLANILTGNVGLKGTPHFVRPQQAINYVECHDNATFFDYLKVEDPNIQ